MGMSVAERKLLGITIDLRCANREPTELLRCYGYDFYELFRLNTSRRSFVPRAKSILSKNVSASRSRVETDNPNVRSRSVFTRIFVRVLVATSNNFKTDSAVIGIINAILRIFRL